MSHNPLGRQIDYVATYSPQLLFPIARTDSRQLLGIVGQELPFYGLDIWTGYELSWLNPQGKPVVALAEFLVPCNSEFIVESKSFKLYLNSLNQTVFADTEQLQKVLVRDLSGVANAPVQVLLYPVGAPSVLQKITSLPGTCLDELPVVIESYQPEPGYLSTLGADLVEETLHSHLLKTNCPVTGQPDWASLQITYKGRAIEREGLLRYIVSFREHQDFHEHCVERIFMDILERCTPETLTVYARYTRRGGLDINPLRTTDAKVESMPARLVRQ
jgi:7-cyano-7-deazaguanine reductase